MSSKDRKNEVIRKRYVVVELLQVDHLLDFCKKILQKYHVVFRQRKVNLSMCYYPYHEVAGTLSFGRQGATFLFSAAPGPSEVV